jgi:hypothetical protein
MCSKPTSEIIGYDCSCLLRVSENIHKEINNVYTLEISIYILAYIFQDHEVSNYAAPFTLPSL